MRLSTTYFFPTPHARRAALAAAVCGAPLTLFAGCSGGSGGGGDQGPVATGLNKTLQDLGVSTAMSQRQGIDGNDLGGDYAPFGDTWELAKTSELLVLGAQVDSSGERFTLLDLTDDDGNADEEVLFALSENDEPWITHSTTFGSFVEDDPRSIAAADIDADGLEEIVIAYLNGGEIRLRIYDDEAAGFASSDFQVGFEAGVEDVVLQTARLNGDRREDLVLGFTVNDIDASVMFLRTDESGFTEIGTRLTFGPTVPSPSVNVEISVGNVDMDREDEVAIVVNERFGTTNDPDGVSRFMLVDDATTGFSVLRALEGVSGNDQGGLPRTGLRSTPLLVDLDGDDRCELVVASRTDFNSSCNSDGYFFLAFEDAFQGGTALGNTYFTDRFTSCSSPMKPRVRTLYANALDVDGDGFDEFHVNQFVFDDFANSAPWTQDPGYQLSDDVIWDQNDFGAFDQGTSSMVAGEFTGDDREDIAIYRGDGSELQVWGRSAPDSAMVLKRSIDTDFQNSQTAIYPLILPVNVDRDSPVLSYSDAAYEYVFSEPIVLAVLAAAPYRTGVGQNISDTYTEFGNTTSSSTETERAVSLRAQATIGLSIDGGVTQSSFELSASAYAEATTITNSAYREERTVLYRTGVGEDTVIFTTIPIDRYTYTVQSHPDPMLIGEQVVVNLPRDPITLQAERVAYNSAIQEGSLRITSSIMDHTIGDPSTYPTRAEKNSLLSIYGGLQFGPQAVGLGSGATSLTLQVGEEWGEGGALEKGFSIDMETTSGAVLVGLSFGASATDTVIVKSGSETTYRGSVGAIEASNHSSAGYQFGLFTYVRRDPTTGQDYEVVQYWVE
ncbi:MAG: hypothetical protein AAGG01_04825 [Planctomycetota bacterium]